MMLLDKQILGCSVQHTSGRWRHLARITFLSTLAIVIVGCRSTDPDASYRTWAVRHLKQFASAHEHVVLVCVYESRFQKMPHPVYHRLDCKGTLVHSYKGSWRVGEHITFWHQCEGVPDTMPSAGRLEFLLLNEHTNSPISIDVGESWRYEPHLDRGLRRVYSQRARR